jgi:hypothetical protein
LLHLIGGGLIAHFLAAAGHKAPKAREQQAGNGQNDSQFDKRKTANAARAARRGLNHHGAISSITKKTSRRPITERK